MTSGKDRRGPSSWGRLAGVGACALLMASAVHAQPLKSYDSTKKDFWLHPPEDWWRGDETEAQKGLVPKSTGQPLASSRADLEKALARGIKLPPGVQDQRLGRGRAAGRARWLGARRGPLFVGSFGTPARSSAVVGQGDSREVKTVIKGSAAGRPASPNTNGTLYVADLDEIYAMGRNPEENLGNPKAARSCMTTCRRTSHTAGNTCRARPDGRALLAGRTARQQCCRPAARRRYRRVNPTERRAELWATACATASAWRLNPSTTALVHRQRPRLARRRRPDRQAQPRHQDGREFRLSVLPSGRHARPDYGKDTSAPTSCRPTLIWRRMSPRSACASTPATSSPPTTRTTSSLPSTARGTGPRNPATRIAGRARSDRQQGA